MTRPALRLTAAERAAGVAVRPVAGEWAGPFPALPGHRRATPDEIAESEPHFGGRVLLSKLRNRWGSVVRIWPPLGWFRNVPPNGWRVVGVRRNDAGNGWVWVLRRGGA